MRTCVRAKCQAPSAQTQHRQQRQRRGGLSQPRTPERTASASSRTTRVRPRVPTCRASAQLSAGAIVVQAGDEFTHRCSRGRGCSTLPRNRTRLRPRRTVLPRPPSPVVVCVGGWVCVCGWAREHHHLLNIQPSMRASPSRGRRVVDVLSGGAGGNRHRRRGDRFGNETARSRQQRALGKPSCMQRAWADTGRRGVCNNATLGDGRPAPATAAQYPARTGGLQAKHVSCREGKVVACRHRTAAVMMRNPSIIKNTVMIDAGAGADEQSIHVHDESSSKKNCR